MSTVGRMIFRTILLNNGRYSDDPIPVSLWTYRNRAGVLAYKICWHEGTVFGFHRSENCSHRVLMWTKADGHTKEGLAFLRGEDPVDDDDSGTMIVTLGE